MLLRPLLDNAANRPDRPAVTDDRGSVTWAELLKKCKRLAKLIRSKTKHDKVAILLPAGGGFVTSFYATLLAGKTAVPINFLLGEKEAGHVLEDSGCDLVLTVGIMLEKLDAGKAIAKAGERGEVEVVDLLTLKPNLSSILAQLWPLPSPEHGPDEVAALLYTSGTSGLPKGVPLTHNNLDSDAKACIVHARLDREGDKHVFLGIVPLFHSTGLLATMIAPVELGAHTAYTARFSPQQTIKKIREHDVTVMVAVPSMYAAIARLKDAGPADFANMYVAMSGGEPLPEKIREAFRRKFDADLMEGYGLTETCGPICVNMPHIHKPGSVGRLIPEAEVRIADENDGPLAPGDTGEIQIKGPMVFNEYRGLPDETAKAKTGDGYFRSGDLGHLDDDGYLWITGRKKDMIIVGGENVYPREIEELLGRMPGVAEVSVIGKPDASRGEAVVAFVITEEDVRLDAQAVKDFCRENDLASVKTPKEVRFVDELPRSPTGKVLKRQLRDQLTP
jgi:long-chain acyl-CoA synthetase